MGTGSIFELWRGLIGAAVLILIAVALSTDRQAIRPRVVLSALVLQFAIGALVLFVPVGRDFLHACANGVNNVLDYGSHGIEFLFGGLVQGKMFEVFGDGGFVFAFRVLPQIIYVSALVAVLYHLGVMQAVARGLGTVVEKVIGVSAIEAFSAVTTIFLGQSEMPVAIKPFVPRLSRAELFAVLSSGVSSVAGSVLAGYAGLGVPMEYLIAASFMAIPGGLLFAKLLVPTTQPSGVTTMKLDFDEHKAVNIIEAAAIGAANGLKLAAAVGAMLIAFIGLIALVNGLLHGFGVWIGEPQLSLEWLLGYAFSPIAYLIGVPWQHANLIGSFIGQKLVFNEFVAYVNFSPYLKHTADVMLNDRTLAITSFALCGFANFSSIAILLGGFGGVAPERRGEVARYGLRAVLAGTLSNLMSATIAGIFLQFGH